jgi:hypothetical protein
MSAEPILVSLLPDTATLSDHDVTVGGVSLRDLAATYGTPLFVYDEATLRSRCREAWPRRTRRAACRRWPRGGVGL